MNKTFEPVILPAAETLKLLDDINETGSAKFCEEEISYKFPADKLELPNVSPPIVPPSNLTFEPVI